MDNTIEIPSKRGDNGKFTMTLFKLAAPIMLQEALNTLLFFADNIIIGSVGQKEFTAVGIAGALNFIMILFAFGCTSAGSIFLGQYWGSKNIVSFKKVLGLLVVLTSIVGIGFAIFAYTNGSWFISKFNSDPVIVDIGARYLRIISISYLFQTVTRSYVAALRSARITHVSTFALLVSSILNLAIDNILVFGRFGAPKMGVDGSAIGTVIGMVVYFAIVVGYVYIKKSPAAASLKEMKFDANIFKHFIKVGSPILVNEALWGISGVAIAYVYSLLGTDQQSASLIFDVFDKVGSIILAGLAAASATMIGNSIGANKIDSAKTYASKIIKMTLIVGIATSLFIALIGPTIINFYNVGSVVHAHAEKMILAFAGIFLAEALNYVSILGILRPGGDTKFSSTVEVIAMFLISLPLSYLAASVFHWPLWAVYLCIASGNIIKAVAGIIRYRSGKWIHNLTVNDAE